MLSFVSQFSSLFSLIGLRGFLPDFHLRFFFNKQFAYLAELVSKKKSNCNNMTFGVEAIKAEVM